MYPLGATSTSFLQQYTISGREFLWKYIISPLYPGDGSGDRIPVGARFSAPVQTGPGAHPASYKMGTGSLPGVKWLGRGIDHPFPSSVEVEGRVGLYIYSPSGPSLPVLGWTSPLHLLWWWIVQAWNGKILGPHDWKNTGLCELCWQSDGHHVLGP
jgi:hypothetical protein